MIYTLTVASPEVEDFDLRIKIDASHTFADLHRLIRKECGWGDYKPSIFYICDEKWRREHRILEKGFEDDTMDEVCLEDLLEDEGQRLQYVFDADKQRALILNVMAISFREHIDEPSCVKKHGVAPLLEELAEEESPDDILAQLNAAAMASMDDDDDVEEDEETGFEPEEFDPEGFEVEDDY